MSIATRCLLALLLCGAAFAEPQAIVLERVDAPSDLNFRVVLWADVPAARQSFYVDAGKVSAFKEASAAELTALRTGAVAEHVRTFNFVAGTPLATIQAAIIDALTKFQSYTTNHNPWVRYGTRWSQSGGWVLGGTS